MGELLIQIAPDFARVALGIACGTIAIRQAFIACRQWTGSRNYRAEMSSDRRGVHCVLKTGEIKVASLKSGPQ